MDTRPLKVLPFRRLWAATAVTSIGSQLTAVAVPKQVYDITNSSGFVGLAGAVALVPLLVFGLWGGAIADTVDRRKLLIHTNTGIALMSVSFNAAIATILTARKPDTRCAPPRDSSRFAQSVTPTPWDRSSSSTRR